MVADLLDPQPDPEPAAEVISAPPLPSPSSTASRVSITAPALELETLGHGRALFAAIRHRERRTRWSPAAIAERWMLGILTRDEGLKVRLLRFVDVFPVLRGARAVTASFHEYMELAGQQGGLITPLAHAARVAGRIGRLAPPITAFIARRAILQMAHKFIAGDNPRAVAPRVAALERQGYHFSLDLLGEFVVSEQQAEDYAARYREMLAELAHWLPAEPEHPAGTIASGPRINLSIKLSALTSKFDPLDHEGTIEAVLGRLRPILLAAQRAGAFINIDMEKYEWRGTTVAILERVLDDPACDGCRELGIVVQAYLRDAESALDELLVVLRRHPGRVTIRLVKGAYWDSEQIWAAQRNWPVPVLTRKRATDALYERLLCRLLTEHAVLRTAVASHNVRSLARAMALREALGVPDGRFEFQVLYGMAGPIAEALRSTGQPVRIYVPCGELIPGMGYLVRRLLENTANDSFLRQRMISQADEERLLAAPQEVLP